MTIFNVTDEKMKETFSTFTLTEINQQPATWKKTCAQLASCKTELQKFLDQVVKHSNEVGQAEIRQGGPGDAELLVVEADHADDHGEHTDYEDGGEPRDPQNLVLHGLSIPDRFCGEEIQQEDQDDTGYAVNQDLRHDDLVAGNFI